MVIQFSMLRSFLQTVLGPQVSARLFAHEIDLSRMIRLTKRLVAMLLGRKVACSRCGKIIGRVFPVLRRGRLEVWGLDAMLVRVEFHDRNVLRFSHVLAENCDSLRISDDRS